jgi:hypothetical protein
MTPSCGVQMSSASKIPGKPWKNMENPEIQWIIIDFQMNGFE